MTPNPVAHVRQPTWARARELSYAAASPGPVTVVSLLEAVDRRLVDEVVATYDLPHYASSAMDGWAVSGAPPWTVVESDALRAGECRAIVTGAPVPDGARAVLRSEHATVSRMNSVTSIATNSAARDDQPHDGEHIRPTGTEAHDGDILIRRGTRLNPAHVALAASAGLDQLSVFARPRVRVVVTGDELVSTGTPSAGQVRDSFGPTLPWMLASLGGVVVDSRRAPDSEDALREALSRDAADHDLIVTTGGTGASEVDHLHRAAVALGAEFVVDGILMRPGHPSVLARFPDGRFLVGLPGNPLAAMLALITLAEPLFAAMMGAQRPRTQRVPAGIDIPGRPNVSLLVPYRLEAGGAVPSAWAGSGMMRGLAVSTGVIVCPPAGILRGAEASAFALPWATP